MKSALYIIGTASALLLGLLLCAVPARAGEPLPESDSAASLSIAPASAVQGEEESSWHLELDAYYANVNFDFPLAETTVPNLGETSEFEIYRYLLKNSFLPRCVNLELSAYPMPLLGVFLRSNYPDAYESAAGDDVNPIEALTAGFREPYALSLFFGNIADFVKSGEAHREGNRAYIGYLFSVGDHHIRHNQLIDDHWLEIEWKLKGDRNFKEEKISWSFRVGSRLHENTEIADTLYLGVRRSNLDYHSEVLSWSKNSSVSLMTEIGAEHLDFQRQELIFGKKFPLKSKNVALTLDFGGIWQIEKRIYSGRLAADNDVHNFIFVIRPNLIF